MMPRVVPCEIAVDISEHLIDVRQLLTQVEVMTLCLRRSECIERKESPTEIPRSVRRDLGGPWRKTSLGWKETRRFSNRQVSTKATEKAQVER